MGQIICRSCQKPGHIAANCDQRKTNTGGVMCRYCKEQRHAIENCEKRQLINARRAGNYLDLPVPRETKQEAQMKM